MENINELANKLQAVVIEALKGSGFEVLNTSVKFDDIGVDVKVSTIKSVGNEELTRDNTDVLNSGEAKIPSIAQIKFNGQATDVVILGKKLKKYIYKFANSNKEEKMTSSFKNFFN